MKKQVSSIAKRIANIALFWRKSNFGKRIVERSGFTPSILLKNIGDLNGITWYLETYNY